MIKALLTKIEDVPARARTALLLAGLTIWTAIPPMSWSKFWLAYLFVGLIAEAVALSVPAQGGTLSEQVWALKGTGWFSLILFLLGWMIFHFIFDTPERSERLRVETRIEPLAYASYRNYRFKRAHSENGAASLSKRACWETGAARQRHPS